MRNNFLYESMSFINNILEYYSWQGVALIATLLTLFIVQLYYYGFTYRNVYRYRLMRSRKRRGSWRR